MGRPDPRAPLYGRDRVRVMGQAAGRDVSHGRAWRGGGRLRADHGAVGLAPANTDRGAVHRPYRDDPRRDDLLPGGHPRDAHAPADDHDRPFMAPVPIAVGMSSIIASEFWPDPNPTPIFVIPNPVRTIRFRTYLRRTRCNLNR